MSRLAKKPLSIGKAKVAVNGQKVNVEGPKGKLEFIVHPTIKVELKGTELFVNRPDDERQSKALAGLTFRLITNMIIGVTDNFRKVLELRGVGYKCEIKAKNLQLNVGYANPLVVPIPANLAVTVEPGQGDVTNRIVVIGCDKQAVGDFAAKVRKLRKPEPYKGKGIRYEGEVVKIKPGKAFAGAGAK